MKERLVVVGGGLAQAQAKLRRERVEQLLGVGDDLRRLADERGLRMAAGKIEERAVVVRPDVDRKGGVMAKGRLVAVKQRIDHLPRATKDEQVSRVG